MKVTVDQADPEFSPIALTVEITSRDELAALWHRLDVGSAYLVKRYCGSDKAKVPFPVCFGHATDCTEELFKAVDQLAIERALRSGGRIGHRR